MSTIYSTAFFKGNVVSGSPQTYTVPAGYVAVLIDVDVDGYINTASGLYVGSGANLWMVISGIAVSAHQHIQWQGRIVLNAGESIKAAVASGNCYVAASGYLLSLP